MDNVAGRLQDGMLADMSDAVVFAPCEPILPGDAQVRVLLLQAESQLLLIPAWSSLERLVAACGDGQPWVSIPLAEVDAVRDRVGATAVLLDAASLQP